MGAAAAIAGVGAAAGIGGALISSGASKSAANTEANAANNAANLQLMEQQQVRNDLLPYNNNGQTSNRILVNSIYGGDKGVPNLLADNGFGTNATGGANLTFQPTEAQLEATPGYQFIHDQGLESVQNSAAARGLGTSGAALKGAAEFATGLASTTLGQQQQIFQQNLANVINPLEYLSNQGENAGAQTGQLGTQGAANAGAGIVGAGNAGAAGIVGGTNALTGGLNAIGSSPTNYLLYNQLLNNGGGGGGGGNFYGSGTGAGGSPTYGALD